MLIYAYLYGKIGEVALVIAEVDPAKWEVIKQHSNRRNVCMGADFRSPYTNEEISAMNFGIVKKSVTRGKKYRALVKQQLGSVIAEWTRHIDTRIAMVEYNEKEDE